MDSHKFSALIYIYKISGQIQVKKRKSQNRGTSQKETQVKFMLVKSIVRKAMCSVFHIVHFIKLKIVFCYNIDTVVTKSEITWNWNSLRHWVAPTVFSLAKPVLSLLVLA